MSPQAPRGHRGALRGPRVLFLRAPAFGFLGAQEAQRRHKGGAPQSTESMDSYIIVSKI